MAKSTIVFVRHGESEWNRKNLFCGWVDSDLSRRGVKEAEDAALALKEAGFQFDEAYTSVLKRSTRTCDIILAALGQSDIPVYSTWRLNERHYGGLTGMNKLDAVKVYGDEQVKIWRRSYDIPPPKITQVNPYYDRIVNDPIYAEGPSKDAFPLYESLKSSIERTLPYWHETIAPSLQEGKRILIVAHGNSIRGMVKTLDKISDEGIVEINIPTGLPFIYELDENLDPIVSMSFLADDDTVQRAMEAVAAIGKQVNYKAKRERQKLEEAEKLKDIVQEEEVTDSSALRYERLAQMAKEASLAADTPKLEITEVKNEPETEEKPLLDEEKLDKTVEDVIETPDEPQLEDLPKEELEKSVPESEKIEQKIIELTQDLSSKLLDDKKAVKISDQERSVIEDEDNAPESETVSKQDEKDLAEIAKEQDVKFEKIEMKYNKPDDLQDDVITSAAKAAVSATESLKIIEKTALSAKASAALLKQAEEENIESDEEGDDETIKRAEDRITLEKEGKIDTKITEKKRKNVEDL